MQDYNKRYDNFLSCELSVSIIKIYDNIPGSKKAGVEYPNFNIKQALCVATSLFYFLFSYPKSY